MTLWEHVGELRRRLIVIVSILCAACAAAYPFTRAAVEFLSRPVGHLVFTRPLEAFDTRLKLSFYLGLIVALPFVLAQAWLFVAPALGAGAKRLAWRMIPAAYFLFLAGGSLAFFVVLPPATHFFLSFGSEGVKPLISLGEYVDFATRLILSFGAAFQTPLVMFTLTSLGVVSAAQWRAGRRVVYFSAFVLGAFFTSPEVLTQICLAIPLIILYEAGLFFSRT